MTSIPTIDAALVAFTNLGLRRFFVNAASRHLTHAIQPKVYEASDADSARRYADLVDLAIVEAELENTPTADTAQTGDGLEGWHLVQQWKSIRADLPIVVVHAADLARLGDPVHTLPNLGVMTLGGDMDGVFATTLLNLLRSQSQPGSPEAGASVAPDASQVGVEGPNVIVEISLLSPQNTTYKIHIKHNTEISLS